MDDKFELRIDFGLIVERRLKKVVVAAAIDVSQVGVGATDSSLVPLERDKDSFGDKSLINSRSKDDFEFFLDILPEMVEIHN